VDQKTAFLRLTASFVLKLYKKAKESNDIELSPTKKSRLTQQKQQLENICQQEQLTCFLSGAGGTGKSYVIMSFGMSSIVRNFATTCK
jgi:DNA replication protein DnaC